MEKVVYFLGAGFSAPLEIPVMGNFLTRSKDLYFTDPERFSHFDKVFETINELSVIKNYYSSDLFNIEEILSILEMREYLEGQELKANFIKYLVDVVKHYTPEIQPGTSRKLPNNWEDVLFGKHGRNSLWTQYGHFVSAVCNLTFAEAPTRFTGEYAQINCRVEPDPKFQYSIVTLNYDCVPETVQSFIEANYKHPLAILEWTVHRPRHRKPKRKVDGERAWLKAYCEWQPSVLTYAIEIDGKCSPSTILCTRFLASTENERLLELALGPSGKPSTKAHTLKELSRIAARAIIPE